jgi:hypothetical protein
LHNYSHSIFFVKGEPSLWMFSSPNMLPRPARVFTMHQTENSAMELAL